LPLKKNTSVITFFITTNVNASVITYVCTYFLNMCDIILVDDNIVTLLR